MGSTESDSQDELTVLVTGFGPFKADFPRNPAWEITKELPDYLPPPLPKSARFQRRHGDGQGGPAPPLPTVRIRKHPEPIRVNYQVVRALVPTLWDGPSAAVTGGDDEQKEQQQQKGEEEEEEKEGNSTAATTTTTTTTTVGDGNGKKPKIDLLLHLGMAGPRPYYSIERRGHRDGYRGRDVDDELLNDEERHRQEREGWVWHGLPHDLETDLDLEDVVLRWRGYSPWDSDLRVSGDAGRYLCDFIYYSSLAHLYRAGEYRRVVFLHVPADLSEEALARGLDLTIQLIRSLVESEVIRKGRRGRAGEVEGEKKEGEGSG
ncbi:hypothetical protein GGTG_10130 [Gaeumannomyces tritici R3-111a-1]|uniref:Pyroglutamyl peptidase type I n=1 Tax=Gaeumannomyces tritici (strain R3-111a-1) TaxID=644352 RepID=J3P9E9_GAET3|nr:hypothetical protein GGTG_10130 [Gaeumannomyces tritici R3-111a-1]EJT73285.1 hypothetical protein GGTG_10130 [Gaeumannomyces tritici R3-111a-1]